jgi:putative FmdB family regulatory protein
MPLYEYHCEACGHDFEAQQRMSDQPLTQCQCCGETGKVKRLVSAGNGLIFKGSGFYITDYKNGSSTKAGASESKPAATETPKSDTKPCASTGGSCSCTSGSDT